MRKLFVVLALALVVGSVPIASQGAVTRCFAAGNPLQHRLMRGNIDGDGSVDEVWFGARRIEGRCRYFVFARATMAGSSAVPIPTADRFSRSSARNGARPIAFVRIDSVPGKEVAVRLLLGASVQPFGFFTMRFGSLRRMAINDSPKPLASEDMFAYGGGLSLMFATDCAFAKSPRTLVFSRAFPDGTGPRYIVERRWYQVRGDSFARTAHSTERASVRLAGLRRRFPEFRNDGLLPHCQGRVIDPRRV